MLRSAAKTLATSGSLEQHCAQPWAEAEQAQQLSRIISPQRDLQAFAVPGGVALHCWYRSWDVLGKTHKCTHGCKASRNFPFRAAQKLQMIITLFTRPLIYFCQISSVFCTVLSPSMFNHNDNHNLVSISVTVTVKVICMNVYASTACTNLFNAFDSSHPDSLCSRAVFVDQAWPASNKLKVLFLEAVWETLLSFTWSHVQTLSFRENLHSLI